MNIAVVGTGYVGLVTGTCLAETGNKVICVDINKQKVKMMQEGCLPLYEPGLEVLFLRNIIEGRLKFTTNLAEAVGDAEIIFLALPTPPGEDGSADLTYILSAAIDIALLITDFKIIVTKSTVPVGTADKIRALIKANTDVDFSIASNPEFLREGVAVEDFMKPDRIVVGTTDKRAKIALGKLYQAYVRQGNPILFMDERSAELTKYAANSFLATKISFMNEIANICEKVNADVDMVRLGIGSDDRIGKRFLFPGVGYGGSCFPKDVKALNHSAEENHYNFKILKAVMQVNEFQRLQMVNRILHYFNNDIKGLKIAVWGLAFKPETDDIREAPSIFIIEQLLNHGAVISVYDPEAMNNFKNFTNLDVTFADDAYGALENADALVVLTEWAVFRNPEFEKISSLLNNRLIFDGRNLYENTLMAQLGFSYHSVGRPLVGAKAIVAPAAGSADQTTH